MYFDSIILSELLDQIIGLYFISHKFSLKGSLEWYPITEKQKERHFKKFGKELKPQRRRYNIKEVFWEEKKGDDKGGYSSSHHHVVISDIEDHGVFYVMNDHKVGNMGQTFRYKFQIKDFQKSLNLSDLNIELLDKTMTMIR